MNELDPLKRQERAILNFIIDFALEKNYLPTIREICTGLNYGSTSTVAHYLERLQMKGLIDRDHNSPSYSVKGLKYTYDGVKY